MFIVPVVNVTSRIDIQTLGIKSYNVIKLAFVYDIVLLNDNSNYIFYLFLTKD